jgi:hypothetical protein
LPAKWPPHIFRISSIRQSNREVRKPIYTLETREGEVYESRGSLPTHYSFRTHPPTHYSFVTQQPL